VLKKILQDLSKRVRESEAERLVKRRGMEILFKKLKWKEFRDKKERYKNDKHGTKKKLNM